MIEFFFSKSKAFDFDHKFYNYIDIILKSPKFYLSIVRKKNFLQRVRQGDPLSLLFYILEENFSKKISKLMSDGDVYLTKLACTEVPSRVGMTKKFVPISIHG